MDISIQVRAYVELDNSIGKCVAATNGFIKGTCTGRHWGMYAISAAEEHI